MRFKIFIVIFTILFLGGVFSFLNRTGEEGTQIELKEEAIGKAVFLGDGFKKFTHPEYNF